jgi:hypothetical protein
MNKKEVCKLKPGTVIELKWSNYEITKALLLEKPKYKKGDVSIKCLHEYNYSIDCHAVTSQVNRVIRLNAISWE